jgi:hypothetical protein
MSVRVEQVNEYRLYPQNFESRGGFFCWELGFLFFLERMFFAVCGGRVNVINASPCYLTSAYNNIDPFGFLGKLQDCHIW